MATDQTVKALNMASRIVNAANSFMIELDKLRALEEERAASGLDLTLAAHESAYATSDSLQHIDGAALNGVINTSIPAIWSFMTGAAHDDNLQKVRL